MYSLYEYAKKSNIKFNEHYTKRYDKFINKIVNSNDQIFEKHHILPKSIFPEYEHDENNLIAISPRKHFLCHYILSKALGGSMYHAFWSMCNGKAYLSTRDYRISSRIYSSARAQFIHELKTNHPRKGCVESTERREQKRKFFTENNPMHKQELRDKVRDAKLGVPRTDALKKKVSETLTGKYPAFLNPRVTKNRDLITRWCLLDQIYDKYQEGYRYGTLLSFFSGYFPGETSMRAMVHYIKANGDPRLDPRWVEFKLLNDTAA